MYGKNISLRVLTEKEELRDECSSGHDTRSNTHGHEFLEQQLTGIGDVDLGDL